MSLSLTNQVAQKQLLLSGQNQSKPDLESQTPSPCAAESLKLLDRQIDELYHLNMCRNLYCIKCDFFKPMRARHCTRCNRCVTRFDHHCPWTGNCVGEANLQAFLQFLFHTSFFLLFFGLTQLVTYFIVLKDALLVDDSERQFSLLPSTRAAVSSWEHLLFWTTGLASVAVGMSVVYLFAYQVKNLEKNLTTVEHQTVKDRDFSPFDSGSVK